MSDNTQSNLSTMASLRTEERGHYREVTWPPLSEFSGSAPADYLKHLHQSSSCRYVIIIICWLLISLCYPLLQSVQKIPSLKTNTPCWEKSLGYFLEESFPKKHTHRHAKRARVIFLVIGVFVELFTVMIWLSFGLQCTARRKLEIYNL